MSWIKLCWDTPSKPEVLAIATSLGIEQDAALGALARMWIWFAKHTEAGFASLKPEAIDRITGRPGFAAAVMRVGWLEANEFGIWIPKPHAHTSANARNKAATAARVAAHRGKNEHIDNG